MVVWQSVWPLDPFKTHTFFTFLLPFCWTAAIPVVRHYTSVEFYHVIGIELHYHRPAYLVVLHRLQFKGYMWDTWRQRLLFNFESLLFSMFVLVILKVQGSSHYIPPANIISHLPIDTKDVLKIQFWSKLYCLYHVYYVFVLLCASNTSVSPFNLAYLW